MTEEAVERSGDIGEIQRLDEQTRIADLPPPTATHEAAKLLLDRPRSPLRLLLQCAEGTEIALCIDDLDDGLGT